MSEKQESRSDGVGRREEVGGSGVYPASGPPAPEDAELRTQASWGRRGKDADARKEAGRSEVNAKEIEEKAGEAADRAGE